MRKVELNMKESEKYEVIKKLIETGGNKKRAAVKLGVSIRTVNRLINVYRDKGKSGFSHGNRGRSPANRFDDVIKEKIIDHYVSEYSDANIVHYSEIVSEELHISVSAETIRKWLLERHIISPKTHRSTRKGLRKYYREKLKEASSEKEKNRIKLKMETLDEKDAHPRRERSKYFGEMIQMDASVYEWIKSEKWYLHLAVDDASGTVVGAFFDHQETLRGYYEVFKDILLNYGIPYMFYTDRRTVFEYKRKTHVMDEDDTYTQFAYACHKLGVEIKTTSVAQAKGRIERLNSSFQSRLPVELRRADVRSIEEANIFLKSYLKKYNDRFALHLNTTKSVFEPQLSLYDIYNNLAVLSTRVIDHGHCISFRNKVYMPVNSNGHRLYLQEGMTVIMIETLDGRLLLNAFDNIYEVREVLKNRKKSEVFDLKEDDDEEEIPCTIKPRISPWRYDDFLGFLAKQKHRPEYTKDLC